MASLLDRSSYSSDTNLKVWDGVTSAQPGADQKQTERELNRPIAAAEALADNWDKWGLGKVADFGKPADNLPPEAKALMKYVASNPALATALDTANAKNGAKEDGIITKADMHAFAKSSIGNAQKASDSVSRWLKAHSDAGDQSKALVQSAGIVMANQTLAVGSDSDQQSGKAGKGDEVTAGGLSQLGDQNPGLGAALGGAAKLWGQPGMFKLLDTAGDDIASTKPDGKVNAGNIGNWIGKGAPTSDADFANTLNQAAVQNTVAGIDTSKIGKDVFTDPSKYTGAQKAAVMVQLGDLSTKLAVADQEGIWGAGQTQLNMESGNVNPNQAKVQADISQKVAQLQQDPDVQGYLNQTKPGALQAIAGSSGGVHDAMKSFYDTRLQDGRALGDALDQKDSKGKQVSAATGLQSFVQQASIYDGAMGSGGKSLGLLDPTTGPDGQQTGPSKLQQVVQKSGQEDKLQSAYTDQVESAKMLTDAVGGGTDISTAVSQYASAAAAFGTALDPGFLKQHAQATQNNFVDNTTGAILDSGAKSDIVAAFGDKNGSVDPAKVTDIVQQLQKQNPDMFKVNGVQNLTPDKVVNLVKQSSDLVRNGVKVQDALSKVVDGVSAPSGAITDQYKKGVLHVLSAVMGGGVLAAKAAAGPRNPVADATLAATGAAALGTLTEGSAKWGGNKANNIFAGDALKTASNAWKGIENAGKLLGGLGTTMGGALTIVSGVGELKAGDKAGAGLNIGSGAAGALAGVAGATEGGAGLLSTAGALSSSVADAVAATSAVLGIAGTAVGVLGAAGYGIYEIVKASKQNDTFSNQSLSELNQFGITGGPLEPGDDNKGKPPPLNPPYHKE